MIRLLAIAGLALACGAAAAQQSAIAKRPATYADAMASLPYDCVRDERSTFIVYGCDGWNWFFTKPGRPEHPGFAKRSVLDLSMYALKKPAGWGEPKVYREPDVRRPAPPHPPISKEGGFSKLANEEGVAWAKSLPLDWRAKR